MLPLVQHVRVWLCVLQNWIEIRATHSNKSDPGSDCDPSLVPDQVCKLMLLLPPQAVRELGLALRDTRDTLVDAARALVALGLVGRQGAVAAA